jgi:hypothetical protein
MLFPKKEDNNEKNILGGGGVVTISQCGFRGVRGGNDAEVDSRLGYPHGTA